MPTPRQRWPYGAEFARSASAELAEETEQVFRELEKAMKTLRDELAPMVPERHKKHIERAYEIALQGQIKQLRIKNLLEAARNGTANGATD